MKKQNTKIDNDNKIDESQFEIDKSQYETGDNDTKEKPVEIVPETDVPIDEKKETIHFPWFIAIVIGVLMVLIIACIIVIKVLEA